MNFVPIWGIWIVTALALFGGHYFRWERKLKRQEAYVIGVGVIIGAFGLYRMFDRVWWELASIAAVGGLTVLTSYWFDGRSNLVQKGRLYGEQETGDHD